MELLWVIVSLTAVTGAASEGDWLEAARAVLEEASRNGDARVDLASTLFAALSGSGHHPPSGQHDPIQSLLGAMTGGGGLAAGLGSVLPALLSPGHEHHEDPNLEDSTSHAHHDEATNLILTYLTDLWDKFKQTDIAKAFFYNSGLSEFLDTWATQAGSFDAHRLFTSLANPSFRRTWLAPLTASFAQWIHHLSDSSTQHKYISNAVETINGLLLSQGFSHSDLVDPTKPLHHTLPLAVDRLFVKQLGLNVNSAAYIKQPLIYFNEALRSSAEGKTTLSVEQIEDRVSEALNEQVVDTILRVYSTYRFITEGRHRCDTQLLCLLNSQPSRVGLKSPVTKLSSLVAAWFLSGHTGTPFLTLYNAANSDSKINCQAAYPGDCSDWNKEDIRYGMEYTHNEL